MPSTDLGYDPQSEPAPVGSAIDFQILAILEAVAAPHESPLVSFARREAMLKTLFATLSADEASAMRQRLTNSLTDDQVAARFARFTVERRNRIIRFLARATNR